MRGGFWRRCVCRPVRTKLKRSLLRAQALGNPWGKLHRLGIVAGRPRKILCAEMGVSALVIGDRQLRTRLDRPRKARDGLFEIAALCADATAAEMSRRMIWIECD